MSGGARRGRKGGIAGEAGRSVASGREEVCVSLYGIYICYHMIAGEGRRGFRVPRARVPEQFARDMLWGDQPLQKAREGQCVRACVRACVREGMRTCVAGCQWKVTQPHSSGASHVSNSVGQLMAL